MLCVALYRPMTFERPGRIWNGFRNFFASMNVLGGSFFFGVKKWQRMRDLHHLQGKMGAKFVDPMAEMTVSQRHGRMIYWPVTNMVVVLTVRRLACCARWAGCSCCSCCSC